MTARRARSVVAVEYNPKLVEASRRILAKNGVADRVTVVQADAAEWTPDEPVDLVVCEMLHSALLREKQVEVIHRFKANYARRFATLPRFLPEATLLAAQPVHQDYRFHGYEAALPFFQAATTAAPACMPLAAPLVYATVDYAQALPELFEATLLFRVHTSGCINAVRFVTKNLLAILPAEQRSIDWHSQHLVMPLASSLDVVTGQLFELRFSYPAGATIEQLGESLHGRIVPASTGS